MKLKSAFFSVAGMAFGVLALSIGLLNTFYGNDQLFGILIILLSVIYLLPVNNILRKRLKFTLPVAIKVIVGIFIIWASLGVGELFEKTDLMIADLTITRKH